MRFMMIMFPNSAAAEAGVLPDEAALAAMGRYNEELVRAGVLLGGDGLHPSSRGARVRFAGGKAVATDGPFAEAKEVIGGYWMIQVRSKEEAVQWALRAPCSGDEMIEVRQVFELSDFEMGPESKATFDRIQDELGVRGTS
ncbi:MAG: YciI family protein [Myxococcota bacterium]